jgi:hypothetical protein
MAITQTMTTSAKLALLKGDLDFDSVTLKIALYTSAADLGADTTAYTDTGEASGTNYTATGKVVTKGTPTSSGTTAYVDLTDVEWTSSSITARGALLYVDGGIAVAVLNFGADKTSSNSTFTVTFPAASATTAIIRIE